VADVSLLVGRGFRSIIGDRRDGKGPDQPNFTEIEQACRDAGLEAAYPPNAKTAAAARNRRHGARPKGVQGL
jgi:protein tyrosine phosphatase (PTP) superfamily phosphohydrolase (DUF442 family)